MSPPIRIVSDLMVSRWAFAGAGHTINLTTRLLAAPRVTALSGYGPSFFSLNQVVAAIILLGFTAGFLLLAAGLLASQASRAIRDVGVAGSVSAQTHPGAPPKFHQQSPSVMRRTFSGHVATGRRRAASCERSVSPWAPEGTQGLSIEANPAGVRRAKKRTGG
jgi:hypothetical protein